MNMLHLAWRGEAAALSESTMMMMTIMMIFGHNLLWTRFYYVFDLLFVWNDGHRKTNSRVWWWPDNKKTTTKHTRTFLDCFPLYVWKSLYYISVSNDSVCFWYCACICVCVCVCSLSVSLLTNTRIHTHFLANRQRLCWIWGMGEIVITAWVSHSIKQ